MAAPRRKGRSRHRSGAMRPVVKWVGGVVTALVIAVVTAIGTGLGSRIFGGDGGGGGATELVSVSAKPVVTQCGTQLFIPGSLGSSGRLRGAPEWEAVMRQHDGSVASPSVTTVSIQGETTRPVTLTGIQFGVIRRARPPGGVYGNPCGDSVQGRFVTADLDRTPVRIVASNRDPRGAVFGERPSTPIRFPWTVSLTDPLLLNVVAVTRRCFCTWHADVSWQSGGKSGVLRIDNGGHGFTVVGPRGIPGFLGGGRAPTEWTPFKFSPVPTGGGD